MLTQERLKQLLHYDAETGVFTWIARRGKRTDIVGKIAGSDMNGYIGIRIDYKQYPAHVLAWLYVYGEMPSLETDHKNRRRSDNKISNLRSATHKQNAYNQSLRKGSQTGVIGVSIDGQTGKFRAHITLDGKTIHLGRFSILNDAVDARRKAERQYFGEFASAA